MQQQQQSSADMRNTENQLLSGLQDTDMTTALTQFTQLQQQLQQLGMTNNAAVFFTSATVPQKTDAVNPNFFHSIVSTNDLRVPMIVHWPDQIPAGAVSDFKWSARDFLPTAAEIGYAKPPAGINGASVLPVLLGRTPK